jgi:hypothetical protein
LQCNRAKVTSHFLFCVIALQSIKLELPPFFILCDCIAIYWSCLPFLFIKNIQIAILLFKNRFTIYDLQVPTTTLNFAITFYRKS